MCLIRKEMGVCQCDSCVYCLRRHAIVDALTEATAGRIGRKLLFVLFEEHLVVVRCTINLENVLNR